IPGTVTTGTPGSYWETPMDITDETAVWAMLTAPITVVKGDQKKQTYLYKEPDKNSERVADITFDSQGLHVLETRSDGWTLVEAYSSSFHDSKIKAWNQLTQGYIRTDMLQEKKVSQKYGLVVDKLTQKLYIFEDGKLYDTLEVSTGLVNDKQPYNETRSGEFLIVSPVGDFVSDNMVGELALRFN
ncbi:MAG: L,D-transpeptidase, partial [Eubacteriales bacterium]